MKDQRKDTAAEIETETGTMVGVQAMHRVGGKYHHHHNCHHHSVILILIFSITSINNNHHVHHCRCSCHHKLSLLSSSILSTMSALSLRSSVYSVTSIKRPPFIKLPLSKAPIYLFVLYSTFIKQPTSIKWPCSKVPRVAA